MKIAIGNDHAGYSMRSDAMNFLRDIGCDVLDYGSASSAPVDFPDIARNVCDAVRFGKAERGIMICGTGVGAAIAANKIAGIRAALCHDVHSAHQCVEHDDANVLCLGAQIIGPWLAREIIATYVNAEFLNEEQFRRRIAKLRELEKALAFELQDELQ